MSKPFSFHEAGRRIREVLAGAVPRPLATAAPEVGLTPAAVLVPILRRADEPVVLFTTRTETVEDHKGQIAFPGGRLEPGEDAVTAALRETEEEISLAAPHIDVLGRLDDHASSTGYAVTPVIGLVQDPPGAFAIQYREVLEVFEVPLAELLDRTHLRTETWDLSRLPESSPKQALGALPRELGGIDPATGRYEVEFFQTHVGRERIVWGLTARILKNLLDRAFGFSAT